MRIARFVALVLAVVVSCAQSARAQGTSGQVPEPISTADLRRLLDRYVHPTKAQWDSVESLHDDYREAFRQLREGEIEKFLKEMGALQGSGMPTRSAVEEFMRKYERVTKRIEQLDSTLLEGVSAIVGDEKRVGVGRAKDARARQRDLSGGITAGMSGGTVDLSEITLDALESSETDRAAIDPVLVSYEQRVTSLSHTLGDDSRRMILDFSKELEKQGFGNVSQEEMRDPERMKAMMESMQAAWKTVGAKVQKGTAEIRELNSKTFRSIVSQLQGDSARRVRMRYIARAHAELAYSSFQPERLFRAALRMSKLDADVKTRIKSDYEAWVKSDDAIVDAGIKADDAFNSGRGVMNFDASGYQEHNEEMLAVRTKRDELAQKAIATLKSIVGDERFDKMQGKMQWTGQEDVLAETGDPEADAPDVGIAVGASALEERQMQFDLGSITPIGIATIQSLSTKMGIDDAQKMTLETLHSDYLKQWEEVVEPAQQAMQLAQGAIWVSGGEGKPARMDAAKSAVAADKQKVVAEQAATLDDALFDDAAKSIGDTHTEAIRFAKLERTIDRFARNSQQGGMAIVWYGGPQEQPVNIARLIETTELPQAQRALAVTACVAHADDLAKKYRETYVEAAAVEHQLQELNGKWRELFAEGGDVDTTAQMNFSRDMMALQQKLRDAAERRSKFVEECFRAVLESVDEEHRPALKLQFEMLAYPSVFADPLSAMPFMEKASAMNDLTADQKSQLAALHAAYGEEYRAACSKMVPKRAATAADAKPEDRFRDEMMESGSRAKIQFERDERSARAVSQLKRILTEEQTQRIPGLADYEKNAKNSQRGRFG